MKKFVLVAVILLFSGAVAQALNWEMLETKSPYTNMFIDKDSIKYSPTTKDYFYAIRFTKQPGLEQVAYLKSDFYRDYIGIVRVEDYDYQTYKPQAMFRSSHAFMKPVKEVEFLYPAHNYVMSFFIDVNNPQSIKSIDKIIGNEERKYKDTKIYFIRSYIKNVNRKLKKNWNLPENEIKSKVIVNFDIDADGTVTDYQIVKPSDDESITNSIIEAIELTSPFPNLSKLDLDHLMIQVTFKKGKRSKSVK